MTDLLIILNLFLITGRKIKTVYLGMFFHMQHLPFSFFKDGQSENSPQERFSFEKYVYEGKGSRL